MVEVMTCPLKKPWKCSVEHATLKDMIAQIEGQYSDGDMIDVKIKVLSEYVKTPC